MAMMIVTYRVMPADGEVEISKLLEVAEENIKSYDKSVVIRSVSEEPVGFGLIAAKVSFSVDEAMGSEELENKLMELPEIGEVTVLEMSRGLG